ncbi:hypothetical protein N5T96_10195 [Aliarcobacter butzleri]|uniref:hypothetical protein n=1 Tax=Aliarcobacter butzleri TaxID=28197 RepID=UPI0021B5D9AA|nr:hypothetical protein [Aliarcobacter butzleri]MCT7566708.1 hypothetical protein [Aliarcobacter butzleri]
MEDKIDFRKLENLFKNLCGVTDIKIENKKELEILINNLPSEKVFYKDLESFFENSIMYKIIKNENLIAKEELTSMLDGSEIFDFVTKDVDYEQLKDIKNVIISIFTSNEKIIYNTFMDFFDTLNFNENTSVHFFIVISENVDEIFLNLTCQN